MSLLSDVSEYARRHGLWHPATRVIAAVSGGSDSVALLVLLHDLHLRGELLLDAVAHLNHGIRGADADEDEAYTRGLARTLDIPFESARVDVPAAARRNRQSIEMAARQARRTFLEHVRRARHADAIATGHTADDQAETLLLRMVRGTGVRGLGGIAPSRNGFIRPLLACSRVELRDELAGRGYAWREDATNLDVSNLRNRVRHGLLPELERHFNPSVRKALVRLADLARTDDAALGREAAAAALHVLRIDDPTTARLEVPRLSGLSEAVSRRVVQHALETVGGGSYGADDVAAVEAVLTNRRKAADVPGLRVEHSGGSVVLTNTESVPRPARPFRFNLAVPGVVQAPDADWVLEAEGPQLRETPVSGVTTPDRVEVDAATLGTSLVVRSRQPGDRIRPVGLNGRKKVQDVFVDRKVSRSERDRVPVVTDLRDRIVWVAGHVLSEDFRVTDRTKAVIILKLRRLERLAT